MLDIIKPPKGASLDTGVDETLNIQIVRESSLEPECNKDRHIKRTMKQLSELYEGISNDKLRIWLLRELLSRNLSTRDIFSFVEGQAKLRSDIKSLDLRTMTSAMRTKLLDIRRALERKINKSKELEKEYIGDEEEVRKTRRVFKKMNKKAYQEKKKKYENKISHYNKKQKPSTRFPRVEKQQKRTTVPANMKEYNNLPIFRTARDMPLPQKPVGPFICSKDIKLSDNEIKLLSKDPKYSVIKQSSRMEFLLELERMLSKHRYRRKKKDTEKRGVEKIKTVVNEGLRNLLDQMKTDGKTDEELSTGKENRLSDMKRIWNECKGKYIFNPLKNEIDFNERRATDYKLNRNVILPKPLEADQEFQCEVRRRAFMEIFDQINHTNHNKRKKKGTKDIKAEPEVDNTMSQGSSNINRSEVEKKTDCKEDRKKRIDKRKDRKKNINLTRDEQDGLSTLKKKIKSGELMVVQTDKSSRFAVMTVNQYLTAGAEHTKKDRAINWRQVTYLQNKVNSHVWWLANIVGYGKNKDYGRMMKNILDHGREVPEMILLCKDHKKWDGKAPLPTRPVISGNKGINTHLSELLSEILEPVSGSIGGGEIASTEEALNRINQINDLILKHEDIGAVDILTELSKQLIPGTKNDCRQDEMTMPDTDNNFKFVDVSGSLDESTSSLDSLDLETVELLEDLRKNNEQGSERGKITSFFPRVERKNLCFSDIYKERSHRQLGERKTDFNLSVKHNCLAGKIWNDIRKREMGRQEEVLNNNKELEPQTTKIQEESENFIFFGADVSALYPSLDQIETAALVEEAVQNADLEYTGMDFDRMCI